MRRDLFALSLTLIAITACDALAPSVPLPIPPPTTPTSVAIVQPSSTAAPSASPQSVTNTLAFLVTATRPNLIATQTTARASAPAALPTYTLIPAANYNVIGVPTNPGSPGVHHSDQVNKANAHVYNYQAHGRTVDVYIEQEGILTAAQERERADYCFLAWLRVWDIFGGYAFPFYECVISDRLGDPARGSSGIAPWSRYAASRLTATAYRDLMTHEIFHAWNFGHMPFDELWFTEGMAQYYNYLLVDPNETLKWIRDNGATYQAAMIQRGLDAPLVNIQRGANNEAVVYYKGALAWYMLDLEIFERTNGAKSLNNVLRRLYLQLGTKGIQPGTRPPSPPRQVIYDAIIAEAGAPEFFNAFFKNYFEGNALLADWHNGLFKNRDAVYLPGHPMIK